MYQSLLTTFLPQKFNVTQWKRLHRQAVKGRDFFVFLKEKNKQDKEKFFT